MSNKEKMEKCVDLIHEIRESGYWPFASPAPCSTEVKIKENLEKALFHLQNALYWHEQEFGRGLNDVGPHSSKIV